MARDHTKPLHHQTCRSLALLSHDSQDTGDTLRSVYQSLAASFIPSVRMYGSAELHHSPLGTLLSRTTVALYMGAFPSAWLLSPRQWPKPATEPPRQLAHEVRSTQHCNWT